MKLYPDSKVCIVCPGNFYTDSTELCHQLASKLLSMGIKTYIYYQPMTFDEKAPVPDALKKYHVPYAFELEDEPQNILIALEGATNCLYATKKSQRVIWWLSVDNYIAHVAKIFNDSLENRLKAPLAEPMPRFFQFSDVDGDIEHWAQSEYARQFLKLNGVPDEKINMVEDCLDQDFLDGAAQVDLACKENIVAFNPVKGFDTTKQLVQFAADIDWRPIENMTPARVQELLALAKVYIDFGNHPGRDRIPREAAISGCVVITNKRGAAANDTDINIPGEFKFDDEKMLPQFVIKTIRELFRNYKNFKTAYEKQAEYRARILEDKNRFAKKLGELFATEIQPPQGVAFVQGLNEESFLLVQEISQSEEFTPSFIVDDTMSTDNAAELLPELIIREKNKNFVSDGQKLIEIITQADAKFLYKEGRIKKFALLEPSDAQFEEFTNFYGAADEDFLIFNR